MYAKSFGYSHPGAIFLFLVAEIGSHLQCQLRIRKRRPKGVSLYKGCCCLQFSMIFYRSGFTLAATVLNARFTTQSPAIYALFVVKMGMYQTQSVE
jgi:hypothetical protein